MLEAGYVQRILINADSQLIQPAFISDTIAVIVEEQYLVVLNMQKMHVINVARCASRPRQIVCHSLDNINLILALIDSELLIYAYQLEENILSQPTSFDVGNVISIAAAGYYVGCVTPSRIDVYNLQMETKVAYLAGFQKRYSSYSSKSDNCCCNEVIYEYATSLHKLCDEGAGEGCGKGSAKARLIHTKRFAKQNLEKLCEKYYFCQPCLTHLREIVSCLAEDYPPLSALQVIAAKYQYENAVEWYFERVEMHCSNGSLCFALYGSMPQIVIYCLQCEELENAAKTYNVLEKYPSATVQGMIPNPLWHQSSLEPNQFSSTVNSKTCKCDLFKDDISQLEIVDVQQNELFFMLYSLSMGISHFKVSVRPNYARSLTFDAYTTVFDYENIEYDGLEVDIIWRCFFSQKEIPHHNWRKQFTQHQNLVYAVASGSDINVINRGQFEHRLRIHESSELYGIRILGNSICCWNQAKILQIEAWPEKGH